MVCGVLSCFICSLSSFHVPKICWSIYSADDPLVALQSWVQIITIFIGKLEKKAVYVTILNQKSLLIKRKNINIVLSVLRNKVHHIFSLTGKVSPVLIDLFLNGMLLWWKEHDSLEAHMDGQILGFVFN